jgi:hypothetical protein
MTSNLAQSTIFLTRITEVPGSNLGHDASLKKITSTPSSIVIPFVNILSYSMSDYSRAFGLVIGFMDDFNTHFLITVPSLISTLYKSLEHTLSLFQPAGSSLDVS